MRKFKKIISGLLCMVLIFSFNMKIVNAERYAEDKNAVTQFEYSLTPGTDMWAQLNHGERVLSLQIPQEILENIETKELVDIVLDYPCFIDMIFYNTYQEGFQIVKEHFNGLQELFKRSDAASYLLSQYEDIDINQIMCINDTNEQFNDLLKVVYIETMLAQTEMILTLNESELSELEMLAEKNYNIQVNNSDKLASLATSAFYITLAEQQGIETIDTTTTVRTPNGSMVTVIRRTGTDYAYNVRTAIKNTIETEYPGASVVGDATIKYNCHAYAWAGSTSYWMNDPSKYWEDGSYTLQTWNSPSVVGQKAYYGGEGKEHSGVVIRLSGNTIKSKWGEQSLVEHSVSSCPYFYIPLAVQFYGR